MTQKRDELLTKIRALLSKTIEAGCTEGEAMAALQKARAMIDVYDVTDEELALTKEEKATAEFFEERDPHGVKRGLAYAVHKFTSTQGWTSRADGKRATCGLPADVEFAEWLLEALDGFVKREYVRYAITNAAGDGNERRTAMRNFVNGCAQRISQRLLELAEPPKQQTANARALVVTKQAAIDEYLECAGIKLGRSRTRYFNVRDSGAYDAGRAAGDRASFGRPVSGSAGVLRIGSGK
jgi:Protein of unknown function (DUF2786)